MQTIRLEGAPPVEIALRRSKRARRLSLRVSALDGRVTMTVPARVPIAEAVAFAGERQDWIMTARAQAPPAEVIGEGSVLPIEGCPVTVGLFGGRSPRLEGSTLKLPRRAPGRSAMAFLKLLARDRLSAACDLHSGAIGRNYSALALRDTRSRWGSCSHAGRLMFSWRLVMAPPEVLNYVAAHEVAHLERMDHSPSFWAIVERLDADWRLRRAWLRENGTGLHAYRFTD